MSVFLCGQWAPGEASDWLAHLCLLYTSDAAEERSSGDLGGRRIIKKKNDARAEVRGGDGGETDADRHLTSTMIDTGEVSGGKTECK